MYINLDLCVKFRDNILKHTQRAQTQQPSGAL